MNIRVTGGDIAQQEAEAYISRARELYPDKELTGIDIALDGDFVELRYHLRAQPFDRIRRITGYLVGTTQRFNNAKRAEERDRVKHDLCC